MERIAVVGVGYVGLVTGVCFATLGHSVVCADIDETKIARINAGECPIYEEGLAPLLAAARASGRFRATTDVEEAVRSARITLIAVGTPFTAGGIDLTYIEDCSARIGAALRGSTEYHTVVVRSTVVPGTTDEVVLPLLAKHSGKEAGKDFGVGMTPEFLREGSAVADFLRPDRVVCGGIDRRTHETLEALWPALEGIPFMRTTNKTAEMIKYASNALLATLISFSNEIANICAGIPGVDVTNVLAGVRLDRRLTVKLDDGRSLHPGITEYLAAGCGFGGSCLPKDVNALIAAARERGYNPRLLQAVMDTNTGQPMRLVEMLEAHLGGLAGRAVGVLGIAFKPGTDDVRESSALRLIELLQRRGVRILVFDPVVSSDHPSLKAVEFASGLDELVRSADAVVLVTPWPEFGSLEQLVRSMAPQPLVVDGRRVLDPGRFERYDGIGRGHHQSDTS